jgi:VCBS repeat-containing protein
MAISTVSINNTPQANGDSYTKTEDEVSGVYCFDVMSNDLGGNAKILWSLDDSATDSAGALDLIATDVGENILNTDDTSLNGAKIWIENGKVRYDTSSLNATFSAAIGALAAGETLTDSFTYAIRMANGTLAWTTAKIIYAGANDGVTVTSAPHNGSLTEDAAASIGGTIAFTDPDASDTHTATVTGSPAPGSALGTFVLGSVSEAPGAQNGSVGWTYTVNNAAAQYLAVGETATQSYTITIVDNNGASTTTTVTVTVTGLNDGVSITSGAQGGSLGEDAGASIGGSISFADVDLSDGHGAGFNGPGALGTFVLGSVSEAAGAASGSVDWTYTVNNNAAQYLAQGESAVETYVVTISDGYGETATQNVQVTITGSNDGVSVTAADDDGSLSEDAGASIGGSIAFTDADLSDGHSADFDGPSGALGTFALGSVNEAAGAANGSVGWTYAVDNAAAQYLGAGESAVETYTVTITDDFGATATQSVAVTINGLNDGVSIGGGVLSGSVIEESADYQEVGSFAFGDVDLTDTHSVSVAPNGSGYLGSLNALVSNDSTGDGAGQVNWRFQVPNAALQYLGEGETLIQSYTVTVDDGESGGATQTITVTLTGDNDVVAVTSGAQADSLSEDAGASVGGSITFSDIDLSDTHGASVSGGPVAALGTFALGAVSEAPSAANGSVGWTYAVNNAAAQYLANGETVVETYTILISDGHGSSITESVQVTITGNNDDVFVTAGGDVDGDVTEDTIPTRATGSFAFTDVDLSDAHSVSVAADGSGYLGSLNAIVSNDSTGDGSGQINWRFNVDNAALQYLGEGETIVQTYTVTVDDGESSTATETVSITITGDNDGVSITSGAQDGSLSEDAGASIGGSVAFTDADLSDGHTAGFTGPGAPLGTFALAPVSEAAGAANGSVGWTYTVTNSAAQYLAVGESVVETYVVTITDDFGETATQNVQVTITGNNDVVSITSGAQSGSLSEDAGASVGGSVTFTDADLTDGHSATVTAAPITTLGTFALAPVSEAPNAANGSVGWTYNVDNAAAQYLAAGESVVETYTVTVDDSHGSTATQNVVVTITGSNDGPNISAGAGDSDGASLTESNIALTTGGSLTVVDPDLSNSVNTVVSSVSASGTTGGLSNATLLGMLGISSGGNANPANPGSANNLGWAFNSAPQAFNFLGTGQSLVLTYTLTSTDNAGASDTQTVTITINGTNDAAVIGGAASGSVVEATPSNAGTPQVQGTLTSTDVDNPNNTFTASSGNSTYGSFTMTAGGLWTYNLNNANTAVDALNAGQTLTDTFSVTSVDGTSQTVTVTINGATDVVAVTPPTPFTGGGDSNDHDTDLAASAAAVGPVTINDGNSNTIRHGSNTDGDVIHGDNGTDTIYGHDGVDNIFGDNGSDMSLYGQAGNDFIYGGSGGDEIFGGSGDDTIYGNDTPVSNESGDAGDDIYGGSGMDTIYGQGANDDIWGGFGADQLSGGGGADTFHFIDVRDTNDTISDFVLGTDLLDFQGIDANSATSPANEAFTWNGTTATAHGLWFVVSGGNTVIYGDTDGNAATAEFMVTLTGVDLTGQTTAPAGWLL